MEIAIETFNNIICSKKDCINYGSTICHICEHNENSKASLKDYYNNYLNDDLENLEDEILESNSREKKHRIVSKYKSSRRGGG